MSTLQKATQTYNGTSIECAYFKITEQATYRFNNAFGSGSEVNGDYAWQMIARTKSGSKTVTVRVGNKTKSFTLSTTFTKYEGVLYDVDVSNNPYAQIEFPVGEYYIYHTQLEHGNTVTDWHPHPDDAVDVVADRLITLYDTRFETDERAITANARAITTNANDISDVRQTTQSTLTIQAGQITAISEDLTAESNRVSQLRQDFDGLESKVYTTDKIAGTNYDAVESLIKQSADSITLSVSQTYSTKASTIQTDTLYYLATSAGSGVTRNTSGWTTTVQAVTSTNKYLWTYHKYTYADGTTTTYSNPVITGVYGNTGAPGTPGTPGTPGATGVGISEVVPLYKRHNSTTAPSAPTANVTTTTANTNNWTRAIPVLNSTYSHLFMCDQIKYTDNSYVWTTVVNDANMENVYTRLTTAEQKITDEAIIDTVSGTYLTKATYTNNMESGLGWKVNASTFSGTNPGECYYHGYNASGEAADVDGWVYWNGNKITIPKGAHINPNTVLPYNTVIYNVYRISNNSFYDVYYDESTINWKGSRYDSSNVPSALATFTWSETNDVILASYISPSSEGNLVASILYSPPKKASEITQLSQAITQLKITENSISSSVSEVYKNIPAVNLIPPVYYRENASGTTYTSNGITWTKNQDGSVTATGTATDDSLYSFTGILLTQAVPVLTLDNTKKYTLSGCPSGGSSTTYALCFRGTPAGTTPSSSSGNAAADYGSGHTTTNYYKYFYIYARVYSGYACPSGGITFYPMLEVGSTIHPFVSPTVGIGAITNRIATNESNIEQNANSINLRVTQVQQELSDNMPIVNLVPSVYYRENASGNPYTVNGITWTKNKDGSVTATGTATANTAYSFSGGSLNDNVPILIIDPTKKYTLSGCPSGGESTSKFHLAARFTQNGNTPSSSDPVLKDIGSGRTTTNTGYKYAYVYAYIYSGYSCPSGGIRFYPMFEVGDTKHGYVSPTIGMGAIVDRVTTNESTITQTANTINLRVSQVEESVTQVSDSTPVQTLIPFPYATYQRYGSPWTNNGITFTVNNDDNSVKAKGTADGNAWYQFAANYLPEMASGTYKLKAGTYTLSGFPSGHTSDGYMRVALYSDTSNTTPGVTPTKHGTNGTVGNNYARDDGAGVTFTINSDYYVRVEFVILSGRTVNNLVIKPMLERGYNKHSYINPALGAKYIVSEINMTPDTISINADKININGVVSANNYFKVNLDGSIIASQGTIAGWTITGSYIEKDRTASGGYRVGMLCNSSATGAVFYAGCNTAAGGGIAGESYSNFYVRQDGYMYCNNAKISGNITATTGNIGGFVLGSNYMRYGSNYGQNTDSMLLMPSGSSGTYSVAGRSGNNWTLIIGTDFGVTKTGEVYASDFHASGGSLSGWNLSSTNMSYIPSGKSLGQDTTAALIPAGSSGSYTIGGHTGTGWVLVAGSKFGVTKNGDLYASNANIKGAVEATSGSFTGTVTASSGSIGNWSIHSTYLSYIPSGTSIGQDTTVALIPAGSSGSYTIGGHSGSGWVIVAGSRFGVTKNGNMYATNANISGTITSSAGNIGGWSITSGAIYKYVNYTEGTATTNAYLKKLWGADGGTASGYAFSVQKCDYSGSAFSNYTTTLSITNAGHLYCADADIVGAVTATSGSIGGWSISSNTIYKNTNVDTSSSSEQQQFQVRLYSPSNLTYTTTAMHIRKRLYTNGSYGDWATNFYIRYDGYIRAVAGGRIGTWVLTSGSGDNDNGGALYTGMTSLNDTSHNGVYIGNDGLSFAKSKVQLKSNGEFKFGAIRSYGDTNDDVWVTRALLVSSGMEIYRDNINAEPYIDFHREAQSPDDDNTFDYSARISNNETNVVSVFGQRAKASGSVAQACTFAAGAFTYTSDRRLKDDITLIDSDKAETFIKSLKPSRFKYKSDNESSYHHGFIYDEVEKAKYENDWSVSKSVNNLLGDGEAYGTVSLTEIVPEIVAVLQKQLKESEERYNELNEKYNNIMNIINELKNK